MNPRSKKKATLSQTEIAGLKDERRELAGALKEAEGFGAGTAGEQIDKSKIAAEIRHYDDEIEAGSPRALRGKSKDNLWREEKELETEFKKGMPTRYEMAHPGKCPGAVRKHMAWLNNYEKTGMVDRYREIQRTLRPGEEKSIEELRKDK